MTEASGSDPGDTPAPVPPQTRKDAAESRRHLDDGADPTAVFQSHVRAARSEFEHQIAQARTDFEEVNERIKQRTGRDLLVAIVIAVAIGGVLLASLLLFSWGFAVFALAAALLAVFEFSRALIAAGWRIDVIPQLISATAVIAAGFFLDAWLLWVVVFVAIAVIVIWRLLAQMTAHDGRTYGDVLTDVLVGAFVQLYVPFFASLALVLLRQDGGEWWVLGFIIVAVASDTGAYVAGISFGRHPMAPRISPKKTWEGFGGAVVAAVVAGVLIAMFMIGIEWWMGVVFGLVILATATIGDLGESMIKRDLGIKDMSSWLPGHGGVLDRLDSILPSATAALALYYLFTPLVAS
ncbi:phosphatidate cytidylyltransferase [Microbacterium sp. NPDC055910]|uniref:phosphatidate cytidylyltransferase n=1 Tax=Microbacterium sp. NPDC055910 TaxID=3345659 RepID=UPI0035D6D002